MRSDPTLRADLIAFLANAKGRVRLSTPDYVPMCAAVLPTGERCGDDRDLPGQRYCQACRRDYAERYWEYRKKGGRNEFWLFHSAEFQAGLSLLRDAA